jgi:DNA-binding protein H-NS
MLRPNFYEYGYLSRVSVADCRASSTAEQVRQDEISEARNQMRELIRKYGLNPQELLSEKKRTATTKKAGTVQAKYRDPDSDATWTGRGRAPRWLNGRDKAKFLIK